MKNAFAFTLVALALVALAALPLTAQEAPPADEEAYPFAVTLGTGHIWTGAGSYGKSVETAEAQVHVGAYWRFTDRFGLTFEFVRDSAEIEDWFYEHSFKGAPSESLHRYSATDVAATFTVNPGDRACIYLMAGGTWYKAGDLSKAGWLAGAGLDFAITERAFVRATIKYRHVEDFLVPVANVAETGIALGFRF